MRPARYCHICQTSHRPTCPDTRSLRWPLAPLLQVAGGWNTLQANLRINGTDLSRAAREGLTDRQADHWATRCGWHPDLIWPDWTAAALRPLDDVFVNGGGWRPAYLHLEGASTMANLQPNTDAYVGSDGKVASRCWCDRMKVRVTLEDVRNGRTISCGQLAEDGRALCTEAGPSSARRAG